MTPRTFRIPFLVLLLAALAVPAQGQSWKNSNGRRWRLVGTVVDSVTGAPLPFASVRVAALRRGATTDPAGAFELTLLPLRDSVVIWAGAPGYRLRSRVVRPVPGGSESLAVGLVRDPRSVFRGDTIITGRDTVVLDLGTKHGAR
jgi:hypothetical protein